MRLYTVARFFLALLLASSLSRAQTSSGVPPEGLQTARIVSVRQIKQTNSFPLSRYPTVARFTIDFAFRLANGNYCTAYETPVLDEVQDLVSANGQEVKVEIHGKKITVILPNGRKIRAELVKETQC
jgi:hypothetical protein